MDDVEGDPVAGDGGLQAAAAAVAPAAPAAIAPAANELQINLGNVEQQNNGGTSRFRRMIVEESRFWVCLSYLLAVLAIHSPVLIPLECAFKVDDMPSWVLYIFEFGFFLMLNVFLRTTVF